MFIDQNSENTLQGTALPKNRTKNRQKKKKREKRKKEKNEKMTRKVMVTLIEKRVQILNFEHHKDLSE